MEKREVRRSDRILPEDKSTELLLSGEFGVLSTVGKDNQPYGVPLSYIYYEDKIYFHCALTGHKLDNIALNGNVSFTVVDGVEAVYANNFTTLYKSVIVFGKCTEVTDKGIKSEVLKRLCQKYLPLHMDKAEADINKSLHRTAVYAVTAEYITGKSKSL